MIVWVKRLALSDPAGTREGSLPAARVGERTPCAAGSQHDQTVRTSRETSAMWCVAAEAAADVLCLDFMG